MKKKKEAVKKCMVFLEDEAKHCGEPAEWIGSVSVEDWRALTYYCNKHVSRVPMALCISFETFLENLKDKPARRLLDEPQDSAGL